MEKSTLFGTFITIFLLNLSISVCSHANTSSSQPPVPVLEQIPVSVPVVLAKPLSKFIEPSSSTEENDRYMEGQKTPISNVTFIPDKDIGAPVVEAVTSSVHARKGAVLEINDHINSTVPDIINNNTKKEQPKVVATNKTITDTNQIKENSSTVKTVIETVTKPKVTNAKEEHAVKKEKPIHSSSTVKIETSSKLLKSTQKTLEDIPSINEVVTHSNLPINNNKNEEKEPTLLIKYLPSISRGQPGFVIPIIITILAVPFMALIGYQAVRRGKEAWRNRHYRRMDYLIDGMYND